MTRGRPAAPPPTDPTLRRHLTWLADLGRSQHTLTSRRRVITDLTRWAGRDPLTLDESDLARWYAHRAATVTKVSLHGDVCHARQYYRWALETEHLTQADPSRVLRLPKLPRRLPRPIDEDALGRVMAAADVRVRAILALAAFAGLRAAEIAGLAWSDVTFGAHPCLRVIGKGDRERVVPISSGLAQHLLALPHRSGPVIQRYDGQPGHYKAVNVSHRANDFIHSLGVFEFTLHSLRHRFGTQAYRATLDLRGVQDLMGHQSPVTTAGYAAASGTVGRSAVDAIDRILHEAPAPALRLVAAGGAR